MKRLFDIVSSFIALVFLIPFIIIIAIFIKLSDGDSVFFVQKRIGQHGKPFSLIKFRTMRVHSEKSGQLTVGNHDSRITPIGGFLRKYKIDELPQLFNVFKGEMSIVGPRPEVQKYVDLYSPKQKEILALKPGLTDYASITYINENEILGKSPHPEETYINEIMPQKINLALKYKDEEGLMTDLKIIFKTISKILIN
jgi:lipopolysaccharide/colanic/teichoic acid biosynthesis glycosyltransferase